MEHITILLIEDNPADIHWVWQTLAGRRSHQGTLLTFDIAFANRLAAGLERLREGGVDVVLLDLRLPDSQGIDTLVRIVQVAPDLPVVVLTGFEDADMAAQALRSGAQSYLVKGTTSEQALVQTMCYAIERQQIQLALQASQRRFRNLIEHNADGIIVVDREGIVRFVNPAAEALFGYHARALVDTHFGFPLVVGETTELDIIGHPDDGVVAEMRVVETEWEGEVAYIASLRDITARKRAETTMKRQEELLRQAQKMEAIGRLAGGVAHDFNNLLTAIIGYSDILLMRMDTNEQLYRYVERIGKAANRAALITRQLLAFSRRQETQPRVLSLNHVVAEMGKMLRPLIGEDIILTTNLDPQLWYVYVDPGQIQQLVMNLVVNARDAMSHGGAVYIDTGNVELPDIPSSRYLGVSPGPYVMLSVRDTGEGIDVDVLRHLFEPFFTTKEVGKGTGLGLAVVYGILQQAGGDIEIHSTPGQGATFKIYLPRILDDIPAVQTVASPVTSPSGLETVLLVEDEEIVRALIHDTLRLHGYHVLEATTTQEALRLCEQYTDSIHLLVTDVIMPEMNGGELAERLVLLRPHMRVLFISGHSNDAVVRRGVIDLKTAFLQKPFTPDTLARKVRQVLDTPSLSQGLGLGPHERGNLSEDRPTV